MGLLCVLGTDFLEPGLKVSAREQRPFDSTSKWEEAPPVYLALTSPLLTYA